MMRTVMEWEDVVNAVKNDEIGVSCLADAMEAWADKQDSMGYDTVRFREHLAALKLTVENLVWGPKKSTKQGRLDQ